jgi:hypothetical protein
MSKILLTVSALALVVAGPTGAQAGSSVSAPQKYGNNSNNARTTAAASILPIRSWRNQNYGISEFSSSSTRTAPRREDTGQRWAPTR